MSGSAVQENTAEALAFPHKDRRLLFVIIWICLLVLAFIVKVGAESAGVEIRNSYYIGFFTCLAFYSSNAFKSARKNLFSLAETHLTMFTILGDITIPYTDIISVKINEKGADITFTNEKGKEDTGSIRFRNVQPKVKEASREALLTRLQEHGIAVTQQ